MLRIHIYAKSRLPEILLITSSGGKLDSILNNIPYKHQSRTLLNTEFSHNLATKVESRDRLPPTSCDHDLLVNQRWGRPHNRRIVCYQLVKGL
jgi:hypothetical protein